MAAKVFKSLADKNDMGLPQSGHQLAENTVVTPSRPRFVARQPVLTCDEKVFGYELLFREGVENYFTGSDSDAASRNVVDTSTLMGFDTLCDGRYAFVNFTRDLLLSDHATLLPSAQTVVELLESVPIDAEVVHVCQQLQKAGYLIALDDFTMDDPREPMADVADIIKVDFSLTSHDQRVALMKRRKKPRCRMLAEKVETREQFNAAKKAGFLYFQGYFFRRPEMVETSKLSTAGISYLRMLQAASRPELDLDEVEKVIKGEVSLCYRLLRYLNSVVFSMSSEIRSVRHGLTMLGEQEVRRWVRLVATLAAGANKPSDLVLSALVRARFCELLSPRIQASDGDLFLMGLLSLMDVILGIPMAVALENIAVSQDCKEVLLGGNNRLRPLYDLTLRLESGGWQTANDLIKKLHLSEEEVAETYWQAMRWAREITS